MIGELVRPRRGLLALSFLLLLIGQAVRAGIAGCAKISAG